MVHKITFRQLTVKTAFSETFDIIFNRAGVINQTLTWLVQNAAKYIIFIYSTYAPCLKGLLCKAEITKS